MSAHFLAVGCLNLDFDCIFTMFQICCISGSAPATAGAFIQSLWVNADVSTSKFSRLVT